MAFSASPFSLPRQLLPRQVNIKGAALRKAHTPACVCAVAQAGTDSKQNSPALPDMDSARLSSKPTVSCHILVADRSMTMPQIVPMDIAVQYEPVYSPNERGPTGHVQSIAPHPVLFRFCLCRAIAPEQSAAYGVKCWGSRLPDSVEHVLIIAMSPDAVVVPHSLMPLLARTQAWLDGAVAIISGRPIEQIDSLMAPLILPCAGEHGAILRMADGTMEFKNQAVVPASWVKRLQTATKDWSGVLVEKKKHGVAVHFRKCPSRESDVRTLIDNVLGGNHEEFEVLPASKAFEIRYRGVTKGNAVRRFMSQPPFAGRIPVFVGDDVTDYDGFRAAEAMGGIALDVHISFSSRPSEVLRWLDSNVPAMER
jgi:trehalose 6-phosphate phosphatase